MNVTAEIEKYSANADKPVLRWLFQRYHYQSQWRFVARCMFAANKGMNAPRVWSPSVEGRIIYESMKDKTP